jgi:outer membrane translocation and assembly module TamA
MATSAEAKAYAWHTDVPAYDTESYGGAINASYRFTTANIHRRESRGLLMRVGYRYEYQRYALTPEGVEDLSFSEKIALGFDPVTGRGDGTLGSVWTSLDYTSVDQPLDPRRGYSGQLRLEHAAPWMGGTFRFDSGVFEARGYYPFRPVVVAARVQLATITGSDVNAVPISERLFLGGANVMRGWGRYELSPLSEGGLPIGGRSALSLTAELRRMVTDSFGAVVFLEGGNVWPGSGEFHTSLRYDVGAGVRWLSPVGIVRGDVGWQLTPIPGLTVDDELLTRRWRIQISIGQAF